MANRSGGNGADDSNRGSTNDAGETSPMMMSSSGIVADADNALLGELLDATEPVVRKNDNNKNNKNNNDNSALAAVTLEEALVESSSSLSMDDNEEEEGEEEKEEKEEMKEMEGATSQDDDDDDDDFYINLDPMEHLSSSINEITRIQKANDQLRLENERILTRAKIAEQRRGEERLESSEHREELKRQVEMLTEDLRREKEIREEELFKLEQTRRRNDDEVEERIKTGGRCG